MTRAGEPAAPARLLGLRLQGFKSFADRTIVEFGPGISAVVGPNGSGKSNLADGLRWALGEQGRSLRTRKSEDVIFAGSERRAALGMADVTLVLDNGDGLLPVEYQVVELGRRLYRSGENEYLLNRQRVRLRDLVDLLDAAHLADNAFLFIGQGMVDQALALRPEERRPLFEEVAGVRRHERRRRRAEEQLAEAEANLARIDDILGELRPQARRLAAQAEQQATRETAGQELAAALVAAAHARWHEGSTRAVAAAERLATSQAETDSALAGLQTAERLAVAIATELAGRAELERGARAVHEEARTASTALQLRSERLGSDLAALARERDRVDEERRTAESGIVTWRRELSQPVPARDLTLAAALADGERSLADALVELGTAKSTRAARGEALVAARRAEAARIAERDDARRRLAEAERRADEQRAVARRADETRSVAEARFGASEAALAAAAAREGTARARRDEAQLALERLEGNRRAADERAATLASRFATMNGRLDALRSRLSEDEARGIARAARRVGGRRLDEDLDVEPAFRGAVEAALGEAIRAYVVGADSVAALAAERGMLALDVGAEARPGQVGSGQPGSGPAGSGQPGSGPAGSGQAGSGPAGSVQARTSQVGASGARGTEPEAKLLERVAGLGGGAMVAVVRRDRDGLARRLLETAVWLPDLLAALSVQGLLPPGWLAVTKDGSAIVRPVTVALGRPDTLLDRRAEEEALAADVAALGAELAAADAARTSAADEVTRGRAAYDKARDEDSSATAIRRRAEEDQRVAARAAEHAAREAAWHAAQSERLDADRERLRAALAALEETGRAGGGSGAGTERDEDTLASGGTAPADTRVEAPDADATALAELETRVVELRSLRDRLAAEYTDHEGRRQEAERRRTRAEAAVAMDEERLARADRDAAALAERERTLAVERDRLGEELALALAREEQARAALEVLQAADAADRARMAEADASSSRARERLRTAEERLRAAEVADLEARLALESVKEQVLVELAGLGDLGLRALETATGSPIEASAGLPSITGDDEGAALEARLAAATPIWEAKPPSAEPPSQGRLASLRRRYHELGAANPFAAAEYVAVRARLDSLESQRDDLRTAISKTRTLIDDLDRMIAEQFRTTFRALEVAFDVRFRQLFGGGFARLSLTEPSDLAATGVEIVARPPGKKAQALAMLSGGERALTAVALLFAMLEVRPVPFCVLDEVDAALDEANVGRFTDALRGLASQTQFVVITHNRGTIEVADALYGVTVGDDSASRVISLRLEEATALAESVEVGEPVAG